MKVHKMALGFYQRHDLLVSPKMYDNRDSGNN